MKKCLWIFVVAALLFAVSGCSENTAASSEATENTQCIHIFSQATCITPKNCTICGVTEGEALGHSWTDATCTTPKTCSKCEVTEGEALGHNWTDATCTTPKTCSKCEVTEGEALGHSWIAATCAAPKTCHTCAVTEGEALEHSWVTESCTSPQICSQCEAAGEIIGHNYVCGECDRVYHGEVCGDYSDSYCPKIYFTGDLSDMTSKKDVRSIAFEYRSKEQIVTGAAKIKVQGTSSLKYNKKNYTIQFYENNEFLNKLGVDVGWGLQNEYCLKANWIDKTHSRNVVTAKIVGQMQAQYGVHDTAPNHGAIDGFPVEVYINGSFHGLYTMNIPKAAWMFAMDENNPDHIVICGEKLNAASLFQEVSGSFSEWSVEVGTANKATREKMQRLFSFILNTSDEEFVADFDQYLDLDAALNYYIMMDYAYLMDNVGKNLLLITYDGKVWYPSLYDLDTSWGTIWSGKGLADYEDHLLADMKHSVLWERMERLFSKELADRYFELRSHILDEDHVIKMFEDFYQSIPEEVLTREKEKWSQPKAPIPGYDLEQIRSYIASVVPRLDQKYSQWRESEISEEPTVCEGEQ